MSGPKRALGETNVIPDKKSRSSDEFDTKHECLICGQLKTGLGIRAMYNASDNAVKNITASAEKRGDTEVLGRLRNLENEENPKQKYHKSCYKTFTAENSLNAAIKKGETHDDNMASLASSIAAQSVLNDLEVDLNDGKVFLLSDISKKYKQKMCEISGNYRDVIVKTARVKDWMLSAGEGKIAFHSLGKGRPDIMCRSDLTLGDVLKECISLLDEGAGVYEAPKELYGTELSCLFRAAQIIRKVIDEIPSSEMYPSPLECDLEGSFNFVPKELALFIQWILCKQPADEKMDLNIILNDAVLLRRVMTISETMIFCARRQRANQVIPPSHMGLAVQIKNEGGDANLISQLHAYGLCISYDEVRRFMTSAAEEELNGSTANDFVPKSLIHSDDGGSLIQEGDDNVDINTETVSGKGSYHSMARALFQLQKREQVKSCVPLRRKQRRSLDVPSGSSFMKVDLIKKPSVKPEPQGFSDPWATINNFDGSRNHFHNKDVMWVLLRGASRGLLMYSDYTPELQVIPFWTGFNTRLAKVQRSSTVVCYAPAIDGKPADFSTVHTTLKKGKALAEACGQQFSVHTFDMQIYIVALTVKWSFPEVYKNTVIRLGGFHTLCTYIACIGKIWGSAGLLDMLTDSGLYAPNTAEQMLEGKQFHRAVRGLTLCYEALVYLLFENFQAWLLENHSEIIDELITKVTAALAGYSSENWKGTEMTALENFVSDRLLTALDSFVQFGCKNIPTFSFWYGCIRAIQIMLNHIRAEREGNWNLHLSSQAAMLPFFFACNRQNYARWSTYYVLEMATKLPHDLKTKFDDGEHSVYFSAGAFRGLYTDIAVEMSVIKDTKSDSGIACFTRKEGTVLRWNITRHILGMYSRVMRERSGFKDSLQLNTDLNSHEQESKSFFNRDNYHAQKLIDFIKSTMTDPFSAAGSPDHLIHIGTGLMASNEVEVSLLNVLSTGKDHLKKFVQRLETNPSERTISFYQPINKSDLKTFANMQKPTTFFINGKKIQKTVAADVVFQRALEIKSQRGDALNLEEVLSKPLTSVPPALFKADGSRRTNCKSDMMHLLEELVKNDPDSENDIDSCVSSAEEIPTPDVDSGANTLRLVDGMAVLQKLNPKMMKTFKDVADKVLQGALERCRFSVEVHYVFDRYDVEDLNPKTLERRRRYRVGSHVYEIEAHRPLPNWDKVMASDQNKSALTNFLSEYIEAKAKEVLPHGIKLYLSGGYRDREVTKLIMNGKSTTVEGMACNHMEADTRLIFNAVQRCEKRSFKLIIVESPDTDVFILFIAHYHKLRHTPEVLFQTGTVGICQDNRRTIPIHSIAELLESKKKHYCAALLGAHALTGCDTVSSLYYIGKKVALMTLENCLSEEDLFALGRIGSYSVASQQAATRFIACLYDGKGKYREYHLSINILRTKLAMLRTSAERLPPSKQALDQHIMRAAWQARVWENAHCAHMEGTDPLKSGWCSEEGELQPVYFLGPSALEILQKFICSCKGRGPCSTSTCPCQELKLKCCQLCSCGSTCTNEKTGRLQGPPQEVPKDNNA